MDSSAVRFVVVAIFAYQVFGWRTRRQPTRGDTPSQLRRAPRDVGGIAAEQRALKDLPMLFSGRPSMRFRPLVQFPHEFLVHIPQVEAWHAGDDTIIASVLAMISRAGFAHSARA
jgi:hypothetical protein